MYCPNCGTLNPDGTEICPSCGKNLTNNTITPQNSTNDTRFCKACGNPIGKEQAVCLNCGVPSGKGNRYCFYCGNQLLENAAICVKCGCAANENTQTSFNSADSAQYFKKLSDYEKTSGIIWLVIGIIQICTLIGAICGVWNIIIACSRIKYSNELLNNPKNTVQNFENQLSGIIIIMVINIFLGALIGVIGAAFDLFVRDYVLTNCEKFD